MLAQKLQTSKFKDLAKKTLSGQASPRHTLTSRSSTSKPSISRAEKSEPRLTAYSENLYKDLLKHEIAEVEETNIGDFNASDLSIIRMLEGENNKDLSQDMGDKKLKEEIVALKKDLIMKNSLVEKLMTENRDLRREMNEMLLTMDDAKDKINSKLHECNHRIMDLEDEIRTLQDQNKSYRDQITGLLAGTSNRQSLLGLEQSIGKCCDEANEKIDLFYQHLNDQLIQFVAQTKSHYEKISQSVQTQVLEKKKIAPAEPQEIRSASARTTFPTRINTSKPVSPTTKSKGKGPLSLMGINTDIRGRFSPVSTSNRRQRLMATQTNDIATVVLTESHGSVSGRSKASPGGSFTPRVKSKLSFRI